MKVLKISIGVLVALWMAYATWSLETTRRNSFKALAVAAQACGMLYRDAERKAASQGVQAPVHPPACNWVD
jgi:thiaminase